MAELSRQGDELVVMLSRAEKAESIHGDLRMPMSSVRSVEVVEDPFHEVHGLRYRGTRLPGRLAVGSFVGSIEDRPLGRTFAAVHHDTPRGIRVRLEGESFDQLIIGVEDPEGVKDQMGTLP
jgi:hypothetical protein